MEVHYSNTGMPYNSIGSFVDFFGGVAYDHVNFIFADASSSYAQESLYPCSYKYGLFNGAAGGGFSYYDYGGDGFVASHPTPLVDEEEYNRPLDNPTTHIDHTAAAAAAHTTPVVECPRHHQNNRDEVVWQDNIDPDHMTYEELLELGEAVGTQSRGLSEDLISLLPVLKFKRSLFSRKRSRHERCVICQMEYKRSDRQMTLPCKHVYHAGCCRRWLAINKACPICYTEVVVVPVDASKR